MLWSLDCSGFSWVYGEIECWLPQMGGAKRRHLGWESGHWVRLTVYWEDSRKVSLDPCPWHHCCRLDFTGQPRLDLYFTDLCCFINNIFVCVTLKTNI